MFYFARNQNFWIMFIGDMILVTLSYYFSHYLRFDGTIPPTHFTTWAHTAIWVTLIKLISFFVFDLYKGLWRYAGIHDLINLAKACIAASFTIVVFVLILYRFSGFARGVFVIDFALTLLVIGGYRLAIRLYYTRTCHNKHFLCLGKRSTILKKLLIIGAGSMGEKLIREIGENPKLHYDVVGFIDDDSLKLNQKIHGIPVLGVLEDMGKIIKEYDVDEIIIAISSVSNGEMRRIVNACKATDISFKTVPNMWELLEGKVTLNTIRQVRYEDLLRRQPVRLNMKQIGGYLTGKKVMVTGGAGSIGSELCRQISRFSPEQLIIVDQNESGLYEIELSLAAKFPVLKIAAVLASIQNKGLMEKVFSKHNPDVVFHAAAYKHVPMMEYHPWEAVFNNMIGTRNVLDLCHKHHIDRFVLVSTDKAVRPTNVMGASKRVAELLTLAYASMNGTRYMVVRFGNVVGSIGSVVPLFKKQIERGGPLTVTHPEVTRYFMTIPEACSLILQAGAIGEGGEMFILKMGVPVRIADMARDMLTLSGFEPDKDIEIEYTGLRPGEKLYEELITEGEGIKQTQHSDIMVLSTENHKSLDEINTHLAKLAELAGSGDASGIKKHLKIVVPEYSPEF
ncbi:polysaccharide biosynthesis protein [Desulfonema magnum]|uniref:Polysaccharide biosynthesis protein, CapD-like n=1 Tax=Desulfonema magnum TaxID=45655 RepID=A0A975BXK0_9BACT|nr:nucleoside-diphosphate sugar epimerase/dehydratase [Desulfonema magnum]QTA93578.1 Polysaccharide biosynthesis protein, CapD-like [Desulfonema magnum]